MFQATALFPILTRTRPCHLIALFLHAQCAPSSPSTVLQSVESLLSFAFASLHPLLSVNSICASVHFVPLFSDYQLNFLALVISLRFLEHLILAILFPTRFLFLFIFISRHFSGLQMLSLWCSLTLSLTLCPAYVLLDLTSHGTDYIFSTFVLYSMLLGLLFFMLSAGVLKRWCSL